MSTTTFHSALWQWIDTHIFDLGRELRLSYLPPLMISRSEHFRPHGDCQHIIRQGVFGFVCRVPCHARFWAGLVWAIKMPLGHLVDLLWRWKAALVFLRAGLISASLAIMLEVLGEPEAMRRVMPVETWYVISVLLAPIGYVLQDVGAGAMTVEAVPRVDDAGQPFDDQYIRLIHTTMQTLGRVAIIGGSLAVSLVKMVSKQQNVAAQMDARWGFLLVFPSG